MWISSTVRSVFFEGMARVSGLPSSDVHPPEFQTWDVSKRVLAVGLEFTHSLDSLNPDTGWGKDEFDKELDMFLEDMSWLGLAQPMKQISAQI